VNPRLPLLLLLAALGPARAAAPIEVISPRADSVSVTIYRDLFALVTETRTVDLPDGPVKLSFDGVVETLLPASAVVADTGRVLDEANFDYEQLTPGSLFRRSVGREILLTRTMRGSGKVVQVPATIVSATDDGVVIRTRDGNEALHCSGIPEQVTFEKIPDELQQRPRLSVLLARGAAGRRTVRVSYLAHGFAWKSDYVGRLTRPNRMDLQGWLTLRNLTNTSFAGAQVQVVAGRLNLLDVEDRGTSVIGAIGSYQSEQGLNDVRAEALEEIREEQAEAEEDYDGYPQLLSGCYPMGPHDLRRSYEMQTITTGIQGFGGGDGDELSEIMVTGMRASMAVKESLADYQLYRLPWPTDLQARQTKQALFLDKRAVKVERFYSWSLDALDYQAIDDLESPLLKLGLENRKSSGLGEPLPEGVLRLFEPGAMGELFSGEDTLYDTAVNEDVELTLAGAVDLSLDIRIDSDSARKEKDGNNVTLANAEIMIANAKGVPVTVEIRQTLHRYIANAQVVRANHRTLRKHGDYAWRLRVPANTADTLTFRLRWEEIVED
jgi:hypothetical protein